MTYCAWCGIKPISNKIQYCQSEYNERHNLCSFCHLNGHACQSSCPLCWYDLAEKLIKKENLCSGCFLPLIEYENPIDNKGHSLCKYCNECILCSFRKETSKEFFRLSYREHESRIQKILYSMQNSVQRIEFDYELCSICMESLNENNPIETLKECQHRFHLICIEKWFKQKACCPCCRHIYHIHDEPSHFTFFILINYFTFFIYFRIKTNAY